MLDRLIDDPNLIDVNPGWPTVDEITDFAHCVIVALRADPSGSICGCDRLLANAGVSLLDLTRTRP